MTKQASCIVVGGGPGGIAAATHAARGGVRVLLLDDNPGTGGQIWRRGTEPAEAGDRSEETQRAHALAALRDSGADVLQSYRVFAAPQPGVLQALHEPGGAPPRVVELRYETLVIATGARERFLPFPGWTLPGVFGAGGLQAMVAGGFSVRGKRVAVAGTGPLLLAVAAHLRQSGATVVRVAEQAPLRRLLPFTASLWRRPGKLWQGFRYRTTLRRTPYRTGAWPVEAFPHKSAPQVRAVRFTDGRRTWDEECDLLACGFHLAPNTELPQLLGCALEDGFVAVDAQQRTSVPGVFCVGEPTGIAGLDAALLGGEIAGRACAGRPAKASLVRRARSERAFAAGMSAAFALRPELRSLARPETIVCRCEDVPLVALSGHSSWTDAKLQTRCGMGPCQARVCGPAIEFLLGWSPASVRPPLFPVPLYALSQRQTSTETKE